MIMNNAQDNRENKTIVLCKDCIFWDNTREIYIPAGKCSEIRNHIEIELKTGRDGGYVNYIETPPDFGCVAGKIKCQ